MLPHPENKSPWGAKADCKRGRARACSTANTTTSSGVSALRTERRSERASIIFKRSSWSRTKAPPGASRSSFRKAPFRVATIFFRNGPAARLIGAVVDPDSGVCGWAPPQAGPNTVPSQGQRVPSANPFQASGQQLARRSTYPAEITNMVWDIGAVGGYGDIGYGDIGYGDIGALVFGLRSETLYVS